MVRSTFDDDKRKEEIFGKWLDVYFYPNAKTRYKYIIRVEDKLTQKKGVDVIIETFNGKKILLDEKATLQYINKRLPTFSFEIKNVTSGAKGWLFNDSLLTNCYLLAWPNAIDESLPDVASIIDSEIMIITRKKVKELLCDKGLTEDKILQHVQECSNMLDKSNRFQISEGISLNFNLTLKEKPVNIVIRKELLKKYCFYFKTIPEPKIKKKL